MRTLAVNCGSSTLKFKLIDIEESVHEQQHEVARGTIERIGSDSSGVKFATKSNVVLQQRVDVPDHGEAIRWVLDWLSSTSLVSSDGPGAVGHRIVHGADYFDQPVLIDDEVMKIIETLGDLAPLHNRPSLAAIRAAQEALGSSVPMVGVFDTAFHQTIPDHAAQYAIPKELTDKYGIRRYGFHGTAHRYMTERYAVITGTPVEQARLVTLQLGNGCSATAVKEGCSVDTSLGLTPLEGLIMGTRSGSVDPSLVAFLAQHEK
ncbi:MAG: acetate kinase, partial [Rubrobacteraceae bacterium]